MSRRYAEYVGVILLTVATVLPRQSSAIDQPISGRRLLMVETATGGRLVFLSKDTIVAPTAGGADDPTVTGAMLVISSGASTETATFDLPATNWSVNTTGTIFRYRNAQAPAGASPVDMVLIKSGKRLKVTAKAAGLTLDEPSQGAIGINLTSGTRRYLARFGGQIVRDEPTRFLARDAPRPSTIEVQITTPAEGTSIAENAVQVRGTVSGPANTGVVVNGTLALVSNGEFVADGVSLTAGANVLTATATTRSGETATASVTVTSNGTPPALKLVATPSGGIATLAVTFGYERTSNVAIQSLQMDFDGDGTFDFSTTNPTVPLTHDYSVPGLFVARLRIMDTSNVMTEATLGVAVDDVVALDALLKGLWDGMNGALASGNLSGAQNFVTALAAERYSPVWSALLPNLPGIIGSYSPLRGVSITGRTAEYAVNRTLGGENYLFLVYFLRGSDGVWRIDAM